PDHAVRRHRNGADRTQLLRTGRLRHRLVVPRRRVEPSKTVLLCSHPDAALPVRNGAADQVVGQAVRPRWVVPETLQLAAVGIDTIDATAQQTKPDATLPIVG